MVQNYGMYGIMVLFKERFASEQKEIPSSMEQINKPFVLLKNHSAKSVH